MKLKNLLKSIEILEEKNLQENLEIRGIAFHSAKVKQKDIYVAINGFVTDGHLYIDQAIINGAVAVIVEEFREDIKDVCQIKVENSRKALSRLSSEFYGNPSKEIKIVGVTATNGKTTTSFILDYIYKKAGYKTGIVGSVLAKIGNKTKVSSLTTPESLDLQEMFWEMQQEKADRIIMEVSSSALELHRVNDVDYDIVSFNNFTREHIDQHGTFEKYWEVKSSLIRDAKSEAVAVLNIDNEKIKSLIKDTKATVITISVYEEGGMLNCSNLKLVKGRAVFDLIIEKDIDVGDIKIQKGCFPVELKIPGYHSVENAMMAIAIALTDGINIETIVEGLKEFGGVERRFEFIYEDKYTIIDDHFANIKNINSTLATIADMEKANVHIVYAIRGNRGVTVNRENAQTLVEWRDKIGVEEVVATRSVGSVDHRDAVTLEEENAFKEVLDQVGLKYTIFDTVKESIESVFGKSEEGDIILLAGCQGMDRGARIALDIIYRDNSTINPKELYKPLTKRVSEEGFVL